VGGSPLPVIDDEGKATNMSGTMLQMRDVSKSFAGVQVLHRIRIEVEEGEVHALVGENGAGKSTLVKILTGVYSKDEGEIHFKDAAGELRRLDITGVRDAQDAGISIVHQEMPLNDNLTVGENIFLGREPTRFAGLMVDWKRMYRMAKELCEEVNLFVDPRTVVRRLSIGQKQQLEIAKCLSLRARLIIFDEPTTALTIKEASALFKLIEELKKKDIGIIYISHKLDEVFNLSRHITVIRDGQYIDTLETAQVDQNKVISLMVGREMNLYSAGAAGARSEHVMLEVRNLCAGGFLKDISFALHEGEILGFFGLLGAGRSELARAIFGIDRVDSGEILVEGRQVRTSCPGDAIAAGLGYVPEDRRREGLVMGMSIKGNVVLAFLKDLGAILLGNRAEGDLARTSVRDLGVASRDIGQPVKELSGGNQQKVLIAKWLSLKPKVLILDEPTRGIDVRAKSEIHELLNQLIAHGGMSIIVISSEIEEILNLSSRVIIMHEGEITLDHPREGLESEAIMRAALGRRTENED